MNEIFSASEYDLESIGRSNYGSIQFAVKGYWSRDSITVYIERKTNWSDEGRSASWVATISHSSGGRDTKEVARDSDAERNFAHALIAAADLADEIVGQSNVLEQYFLDERAVIKHEAEEAHAQMLREHEADQPLGEEAANKMIAAIAESGNDADILMFPRGKSIPFLIEAINRAKLKFYVNGVIESRKEVIRKLAESSHRSCIAAGSQK